MSVKWAGLLGFFDAMAFGWPDCVSCVYGYVEGLWRASSTRP